MENKHIFAIATGMLMLAAAIGGITAIGTTVQAQPGENQGDRGDSHGIGNGCNNNAVAVNASLWTCFH